MKTIIPFFFLLCVSGLSFAQSSQDPEKSVRDLKNGVLVVRLRTQSNKIAKLNELLQSGELRSDVKTRYLAELEATRQEVERENRLLMQAFTELYHFSPVLFLHDTLAPALKSANPSGIFLNELTQIDPQRSLGDRYFLIAGIGLIAASEGASGNDALIVYDREFNAMAKPFPAYTGVTTIRLFFKTFTASDENTEAFHLRKMVERLDRKLAHYYARVQGI
ncbi:MAG: hypothetical protein IPJ40_15200 [Saprospirales bacterium]|nr:hypothetical protein [Saprospirales bacterium]